MKSNIWFDPEPDPEVLENPGFVLELNRRFDEVETAMRDFLPLEEYDRETISC